MLACKSAEAEIGRREKISKAPKGVSREVERPWSAESRVRRARNNRCTPEGPRLVTADRWFPSSKTCSDCGFVLKKLDLSVDRWQAVLSAEGGQGD